MICSIRRLARQFTGRSAHPALISQILGLLAMVGDQSLFTRSDGVERLWEISAPLLDAPPPVESYDPGSWGPPPANRLIAPFRWHLPES